MAEEPTEAPVEEQDKPESPQAPEQGQAEPEAREFFSETFQRDSLPEPLQAQYDLMRGDYTRKTQEISSERQLLEALRSGDPELQARAAEALGLEYEAPAEDDFEDYQEPSQAGESFEKYENRIAALESEREQERFNLYLDGQLDAVEKQLGRDLGEIEMETIIALAERRGWDFGAALEALQRQETGLKKRIVDSKRTPRPPSPDGQSGTEQVDLNNEGARIQRMAAIMDQGDG